MKVARRFQKLQSFYDFVVGLSWLVLCFFRNLLNYFSKSIIHGYLRRGMSPLRLRWSEEVALITGGSQGIGWEMVKVMLEKGVKAVVILDLLPPKNCHDSRVHFFQCDIADMQQLEQVYQKLTSQGIHPTLLINNAGIWNEGCHIETLPDERLLKIMHINTIAPFRVIRLFLPHLKECRHGRIVNISSLLGIVGTARMSDYCATKYAVYGMTESLRRELKANPDFEDIRTLTVCPFHVRTALFGERIKWEHSWLLSTLEPAWVGQQVIQAMEEGREELLLPGISRAFRLLQLFPAWFSDVFNHTIGADDGIHDVKPLHPIAVSAN